jgi:PAS domain S-box-containing protein
VFLNQSWLDFTGRPVEEQLGEGWTESIHAADRAGFIEANQVTMATRGAIQAEYRLRRADGEYRWMLGRAVTRVETDGAFAGLIASCVDVTDIRRAREVLEQARDELSALVAQRTADLERSNEHLRAEMGRRAQIEEEVAQARRIESVAVLAGGIAHQFNNLLTVIVGRSQLLLDRRTDELVRHDLGLVQWAAERGRHAHGTTPGVWPQAAAPVPAARSQHLRNRAVALSTVVGGRIRLTLRLEERFGRSALIPVSFSGRFSTSSVRLRCDAEWRTARLETANIDLDEAFVRTHPDARPGST